MPLWLDGKTHDGPKRLRNVGQKERKGKRADFQLEDLTIRSHLRHLRKTVELGEIKKKRM